MKTILILSVFAVVTVIFALWIRDRRRAIRYRREARHWHRVAHSDELTGLANERALRQRMAERRHAEHEVTVIMMDLDRFKQVNDTYGHQVGDAVLKEFASLCRTHLRSTDVVVRLHGDEFLILLQGSDIDHARVVAEKIRVAFLTEVAVRYPLPDGKTADVSFGIVSGRHLESMLRESDARMYRHKRNKQ